ncbi:thiamine pyrophosphate-dependent enzyme [Permianibacter aggregans]|uniref:3-methyl-2-oxobutanoate dehydrogenase (2-methylpropanoyl-transferring) n=1 Tax=Permianibacter aggregans TaxID=1510150 RepID=A0A4R6UE77_9GAMM|nr:thiamine pyrophosphate-dependent enzyme [Permianibacter aggregans]QGX38511.1 MFS transporter [Permianibacter aggregans]TDQ45070.1 branched-chain alpha-keto acid dehydrogenase E1 component [Permianibacter aggregans]
MLDRAKVVDENFTAKVQRQEFPRAVRRITAKAAGLDQDAFIELFRSQMLSRHLDLRARILKDQGLGFYTIGSSGHEGNAAVAKVFRHTDMAFLHYRSGAFMVQRSKHLPEIDVVREQMLSFVCSKLDPISQGRHKVFGSVPLWVPPQTSTIASHLPKAVGAAHGLGLAKRIGHTLPIPDDSVILTSFGDASYNHASSQAAFNTAEYWHHKGHDMPLVFICEDNGIGISVSTPHGWVRSTMERRTGIAYVACSGLHLPDVYLAALEAEEIARAERRPVFLHVETIRLMGHAGNDTESQYHAQSKIEATEAQDPLLHTARIAIEEGFMTSAEITEAYESLRAQVEQAAEKALATPKLDNADDIMASVAPKRPNKPAPAQLTVDQKTEVFGKALPQLKEKRSLANLINFSLSELMKQYPNMVLFGEDVGKKGGVYRVTADIQSRFSEQRVFDTLLEETSILGAAIGYGHLGLLPVPEIQFLAYTHNAEDQIRGEAATLSFFSSGQYSNPMIVRVAGLAYQKGFGGHFHNDNAFAFLREIPGVILAIPSNGHDAALMLKECARLAEEQKRVIVFLEPIALYHVKDLHEKGDNGWAFAYPEQAEPIAFGEPGKHFDGKDLLLISYGNGNYLCHQAEKILREQHNTRVTVLDLRWLAPLNVEAIIAAVKGFKHVLVVDECRKTGSVSEEIITHLVERCEQLPKLARITGKDSFITTGNSWQYLLPSTQDIVQAGLDLLKK